MTYRAMILAAGRGERMRPLTDHTPKPLLMVGGKPLIQWHIERLARAGVTEMVINHAHLGNQIEQVLRAGEQFGVGIRYSAEHEALETAGGIAQALPLLDDAPFIVVSADVFCVFDFAILIPVLQGLASGAPGRAHLVMVPNASHHPTGDFGLKSGQLLLQGGERLTYSGIACFHPAFFATVPHGAKMKLVELLRPAIGSGRVSGERFDGRWLDVGTPARLEEANELAVMAR